MALTYDTATAKQVLHKPVQIKNLITQILNLSPPHDLVISSATAANCINLIFTDIQTDAHLLIQEMSDTKDFLRIHSNHLFKTSDEITLEMMKDMGNTAYIQEVRTQLSNVFDDMQTGLAESTDLSTKITQLVVDFYSGTSSNYYTNVDHYRSGVFDANYDIPTMDTIVNQFMNANTRHYEFKTSLAHLIDKYPNITLEDDANDPIAKLWPHHQIFVALEGDPVTPTMRLYPTGDSATGTPIWGTPSYSIWEDTIILKGTYANFDIYWHDRTASLTAGYWLDKTGAQAQVPLGGTPTRVSADFLRGLEVGGTKTLSTAVLGGHGQDASKCFIVDNRP